MNSTADGEHDLTKGKMILDYVGTGRVSGRGRRCIEATDGMLQCTAKSGVRNYAANLLSSPVSPLLFKVFKRTRVEFHHLPTFLFPPTGGIVCNARKQRKRDIHRLDKLQPCPAHAPKQSTSVIKLGPSESIVNVHPFWLYIPTAVSLVYALEHVIRSQIRTNTKGFEVW